LLQFYHKSSNNIIIKRKEKKEQAHKKASIIGIFQVFKTQPLQTLKIHVHI